MPIQNSDAYRRGNGGAYGSTWSQEKGYLNQQAHRAGQAAREAASAGPQGPSAAEQLGGIAGDLLQIDQPGIPNGILNIVFGIGGFFVAYYFSDYPAALLIGGGIGLFGVIVGISSLITGIRRSWKTLIFLGIAGLVCFWWLKQPPASAASETTAMAPVAQDSAPSSAHVKRRRHAY